MANCFQQPTIEDDSTILFSSSNSPENSTTPSSSSSPLHPPPQFPLTLTVSNLSYSIPQNSSLPFTFSPFLHKPKANLILNSVSFVAKSSQLLAIVGPSGTGKSTLLKIISGRLTPKDFDPKTISINSWMSPDMRFVCGFVRQEDYLLPLLTVKETLMFSAKFRLKGLRKEEREEKVERLMHELGLVHVGDSFVGGDEERRGISGGERKRVSIGVDIIHDPPILLLDEPTSGLDSTSALQIINLLSTMSKSKQRIVVLSIHQPGYRILQYISHFLILSHGQVVHSGSLDSLVNTMSKSGFRIPTQLNPLEFAMEIIHTLLENSKKDTNIISLWDQNCQEDQVCNFSLCPERVRRSGKTVVFEIIFLCSRFWKIIYRTKQLLLARTMQALVGGIGLGSVYIKVRKDRGGVEERLGLFAFSLSFLLSSTLESLPIYLQERKVLMKEVSRGDYKISSYLIANTLVFFPFLFVVALLFSIPVYWIVGLNPSLSAFTFFTFVVWLIVLMASSLVLFLSAISPDFISGNSLISTVLGAFFLFSGYFIPKQSIPKYWLFMYYVSVYRYPLDSLLVNEYWSVRGNCFSWSSVEDHGFTQCLVRGSDVLRSRGLERDVRWVNVGIMLGFFVLYRLLCWVVLCRKALKTTV